VDCSPLKCTGRRSKISSAIYFPGNRKNEERLPEGKPGILDQEVLIL